MPARPIVYYPDPRLKTVCTDVLDITNDLRDAAQDLLDMVGRDTPRRGASRPGLGDQMVGVAGGRSCRSVAVWPAVPA